MTKIRKCGRLMGEVESTRVKIINIEINTITISKSIRVAINGTTAGLVIRTP